MSVSFVCSRTFASLSDVVRICVAPAASGIRCIFLISKLNKSRSLQTPLILIPTPELVYRTWRYNSFIPDTLFPHKLLRLLATEDIIGITTFMGLFLFSYILHSASCVCSLSLRFKYKKMFLFALSSRPRLYVTSSLEWSIPARRLYATSSCINYFLSFSFNYMGR